MYGIKACLWVYDFFGIYIYIMCVCIICKSSCCCWIKCSSCFSCQITQITKVWALWPEYRLKRLWLFVRLRFFFIIMLSLMVVRLFFNSFRMLLHIQSKLCFISLNHISFFRLFLSCCILVLPHKPPNFRWTFSQKKGQSSENLWTLR